MVLSLIPVECTIKHGRRIVDSLEEVSTDTIERFMVEKRGASS